jgi:hypothetical protein
MVSPSITKFLTYRSRIFFRECYYCYYFSTYATRFEVSCLCKLVGDHVISIDDVYGGTQRYFRRISAVGSAVTFSFVDFTKEGALEAAFTDKTKVMISLHDQCRSWCGWKPQQIQLLKFRTLQGQLKLLMSTIVSW